jgi:hypothetical protein
MTMTKQEKVMKNMTWEQLAAHIAVMDEEQRQGNVTIHVTEQDEFMPIQDIDFVGSQGNGVLDSYHPFLVMEP